MILDSVKEIQKLDKENMLELLLSFPKQCVDAIQIGAGAEIKSSYKTGYGQIVFTGLGGSAIGADVINGYVGGEIDIPIFVNRNYTLPHFVGERTLLFAVSYSGNTEETLSAYEEAKKKNAKVIAITSGGKLGDAALKNGDSVVTIPKGLPPRCALGYSFIPPTLVLAKLGFIKDKTEEIKQAAGLLTKLAKENLAPAVDRKKNISKDIAEIIHKKFAVIYGSNEMSSVVTRWRGEFAENAKALSSSHVFPEMNHNEIVGWMNPKELLRDFVAIILKDKGDHARIKKRMMISKAILEKEKYSVIEVESRGEALLERMLSLIYIGDFTSFYLSILNGIDPTPVDRITYLKKQLAA